MADLPGILSRDFWDDVPEQHRPALKQQSVPYDLRPTTLGEAIGMGTFIPATIAGTVAGATSGRVGGFLRSMGGAAAGAVGSVLGAVGIDAATGNIVVSGKDQRRGQVPMYSPADDTDLPNGSWLPELKLPRSAPIHPPGTLAPVYDRADAVTGWVHDWLADARKTAEANGVKGGAAARGEALYDLVTSGIPSLASSAAKVASAPIDYFRGHTVDAGVGDVANVGLAAYGGRKIAQGRPEPAPEPPPWMQPAYGVKSSNSNYVAAFDKDYFAALGSSKQKRDADAYKELLAHTNEVRGELQFPMAAYRGSNNNTQRFRSGGGLWASDDPGIASSYAYSFNGNANVMPLSVTYKNPLVYTADKPAKWSALPLKSGHTTYTDDIVALAKSNGHDGVIFRNINDAIHGGDVPSTILKTIGRGTTRSKITGELLYGLGAGTVAAPGILLRDQNE